MAPTNENNAYRIMFHLSEPLRRRRLPPALRHEEESKCL